MQSSASSEERTEPYKKYGEGALAADDVAMRREPLRAAGFAGRQGVVVRRACCIIKLKCYEDI
jgi:hypothetical protein